MSEGQLAKDNKQKTLIENGSRSNKFVNAHEESIRQRWLNSCPWGLRHLGLEQGLESSSKLSSDRFHSNQMVVSAKFAITNYLLGFTGNSANYPGKRQKI